MIEVDWNLVDDRIASAVGQREKPSGTDSFAALRVTLVEVAVSVVRIALADSWNVQKLSLLDLTALPK